MTLASSLLYAIRILFPKSSPSSSSGRKSNGERSLAGALLCIGLSLVPLVSVLVISDGMIQGITGRLIGLCSQDIAVFLDMSAWQEKYGGKITEKDCMDIAQRLSLVEGVTDAFPELDSTALAAGKSSRSGASVRAVQGDIFSANKAFASLFTVVEGSVDMNEDSSGKNKTILCKKIADDLGLHAGDSLRLICVNKTAGGSLSPRMVPFTVSGIVSSGYQELDALWVFIPLEAGLANFSPASSKLVFGLKTADSFSPELMQVKDHVIDDVFGFAGNEELEGATVWTWNDLNSAQYQNYSSTKALLLLIMLLIVLVASVNISSALVMIVMERRKEIAILKSVGGSAGGITVAFLLAGFSAGCGGVLLGIPLGLLAGVNINTIINFMEKIINFFVKFLYILFNADLSSFKGVRLLDPAFYLQDIPISVPFKELLVIAFGTLLLSLAVSAIPAVKAGREKPLDTLRKL